MKKPNKSNKLAIINANDYHRKVRDTLNDPTTFMMMRKDPTEQLKTKVDSLIHTLHMTIESSKSISKQTGHSTPAHLYGKPKFHKKTLKIPSSDLSYHK